MYAPKRTETATAINTRTADSRNAEANVCNPPASKQGYIYIPFAAQDLVDQSLGINLIRHLKGKSLYPLIVPSQNVLMEMEKLRSAEVNKLTTQINRISHGTHDIFVTSIAKLSQQLFVLKQMNFSRKLLNHLSPERDILYVIGHGLSPGPTPVSTARPVFRQNTGCNKSWLRCFLFLE